jgi:hypothetical protein
MARYILLLVVAASVAEACFGGGKGGGGGGGGGGGAASYYEDEDPTTRYISEIILDTRAFAVIIQELNSSETSTAQRWKKSQCI